MLIEITGQPKSKLRARAFVRHGRIAHYTPKETTSYEQHAALAIRSAALRLGLQIPIKKPVTVDFVAYFLNTKKSKFGGWHTVKPDLDNVAKIILDSIVRSGVIDDDKQVVHMTAAKRWCPIDNKGPRVVLVIELADQ